MSVIPHSGDQVPYPAPWQYTNLVFKEQDDAFYNRPSMAPRTWLARIYRYADGRAYRSTVRVLFYADDAGCIHAVGGLVRLSGGEVLVYLGEINPSERASVISAEAPFVLWGTNPLALLHELKQRYPDPVRALFEATHIHAVA